MRLGLFHIACLLLDVVIVASFSQRAARAQPLRVPAFVVLFLLPFASASWVFEGEMPGFSFMQLEAWVVFVHAPALALVVAWMLRARRRFAATVLTLALALVSVGVYAFFVQPHALVVRRYVVRSAKVTTPFRIVVLSDIQTDHVGEYERRAIARAMAERPSLLLFPGDYIQLPGGPKRARETAALRSVLQSAHAPLGAYAVQGNVDPNEAWPQIFEGTRIAPITRTTRIAGPNVTVTALSFDDSFDAWLRVEPEASFHVVFGHGPDFALGDVRADLLVAGHTHGGQVVLPFFGPLLTLSRVPRAWAGGLTQLSDGRTLVVSRGIGMERGTAPRLRFLCPPEIVVIDVLPLR